MFNYVWYSFSTTKRVGFFFFYWDGLGWPGRFRSFWLWARDLHVKSKCMFGDFKHIRCIFKWMDGRSFNFRLSFPFLVFGFVKFDGSECWSFFWFDTKYISILAPFVASTFDFVNKMACFGQKFSITSDSFGRCKLKTKWYTIFIQAL